MENQFTTTQENKNGFDIRLEINKYLPFWFWFVGFTAATLFIANFYLRYTPTVYQNSAKIKILDNSNSPFKMSTEGIFIVGKSKAKLGNDLQIIKSDRILQVVARELNLTTTFLTAREAIKYFKINGPGSLTLTSSALAISPSPEHFKTHAYAAAKGAINTLVTPLSSTYLDKKIRVNAVSPSLVATPMAARAAENKIISEFTIRKQPLIGNQLPVENVVSGYIYLIENPAVTGQILEIDGGWSAISGI